ncbi:nucleotidyltransferase family protein [Mariniluteicoccus flavus]
MMRTRVAGLLLAAGAGRRLGTPKALVADADDEPWVATGVARLRAAGCDPVTVVVGAEAERVGPVVEAAGAYAVVAERWADGMGASLATGLARVAEGDADAVLIMLVDLPGVAVDALGRVVGEAQTPDARRIVARAAYGGRPGHPVLVGRDHWADLAAELGAGDRGARDWLAGRTVALVECADVADGADIDDAGALARWRENEGGRT